MNGPKPPGREPEGPESAGELSHQADSGSTPGGESEPLGEPEDGRFDDSAEPAAADDTGQTDAYSRAYSAPESEHFTSGPYVPADMALYDYDGYDELLSKLGTHYCGKSCLYIKRLSDVNVPTLKKLIDSSVRHLRKTGSRPNARAKSAQ